MPGIAGGATNSDIRFLERPEQLVQPVDQRLHRAALARPLRPRLQGDEAGAGVRSIDLGKKVQARDGEHAFHFRLLLDHGADLLEYLFGPLQRCTGRQLRHHQQVPLVILGQKPAGPQPNQESERHDDCAEHAERNGGTADGMAHGVGVLLRGARKGAIECSEAASKKPGGLGLRARFQQASRTEPA